MLGKARLIAFVLSCGAIGCASCASSQAVRAALHDDLPALKRAIQAEQKAGTLDRDLALELAQAVAEREVASATAPSGTSRVRRMRGCASRLEDALEERAEQADDIGAEAMLVLLESRAISANGLVERYGSSSNGAFRAVAARAAVARNDAATRQKFFVDPDQRVRRAAAMAALEVRNSADVPGLLEAARLDPDPLTKSLAARAAGAIGGERVVLALKDLWPRAEQAERLSLVDAWAGQGALKSGGRQQLIWVMETAGGLQAISAAGALLRNPGEGQAGARAIVTRFIQQGTTEERKLAIRLAPSADTESKKALLDAAKSENGEVAVAALERLLEDAGERAKAQTSLRRIAESKSQAAPLARSALAKAEDATVASALANDLRSKDPYLRRSAALDLARLGKYSQAASALADEDPDVRVDVACSLLAQEK